MKKFLLIFVTVIVILFLGISYYLDRIVRSGIESYGSEIAGTQVRVESVSVSPISGEGSIQGFTVANPDGFEGDYMLSISDFSISLDVQSLLTDEILIHEIILSEASFFVEQTTSGNNVMQILNNIDAMAETETSEATMIIDRFYMENAEIYIGSNIGEDVEANYVLESLEVRDIGREGQNNDAIQTVANLADRLAEEVLSEAVNSGLDRIKDAFRDFFEN